MADNLDAMMADIMAPSEPLTASSYPGSSIPGLTPAPSLYAALSEPAFTPANPALLPPAEKQAYIAQLEAQNAVNHAAVQKQLAAADRVDTALAFGSSLADALAFGFGREGAAAVEAALTDRTYDDIMREYGTMGETLATQSPYATAAGGITGSLIPLALTGPVRGSVGLGQELLLGQTAVDAVPTIGQLARIGAAQGALQGAGAAEPTEANRGQDNLANRIVGGTIGAGIGAVGTPLMTKATGATIGYVGRKLAENNLMGTGLREALAGLPLTSERGAIATGKEITEGGYTPAELIIAKKLAEGSVSDIDVAIARANAAQASNVPMFLPEAIQSPAVYQSAKLAAVKPGGITYAQKAIEGRAAEAGTRVENVLSTIAPSRSTSYGANVLTKAAQDIQDQLVQGRSSVASQLYKQARLEAPEIVSKDLTELISKDKALKSAIKTVKGYADNADLPDTSLEVLDQARRIISDKMDAAGSNERRLLQRTKDKLTSIMEDAAPTYKEARKAYEEASRPLNALEQSKFTLIRDFDPDKPESLGQIFNQAPEVIESLRDNFVSAGKIDEWNAGVRAYLQHLVEKQPEEAAGRMARLVQSTVGKNRIKAALGEQGDQVISALQSELEILKSQPKYYAGSPTAPLTFEEADTRQAADIARKALGGKFREALAGLFAPDDTALYRQLAQAYFTPGQNIAQLQKLRPLVEQYQLVNALNQVTQRGVGTTLGKAAGLTQSTATDIATSSTSQSPKLPTNKTSLGIGAVGLGTTELDAMMKDIMAPSVSSAEANKSKASTGQVAARIDDIVSEVDSSLRPSLIKAVIMQESAGNPKIVSNRGAVGLMQLMPDTAKMLGVDPLNPIDNVKGGSRYLQQLINQFGDEKLALAAYNWGPTNLQKALNYLEAKGKTPTWSNVVRFGEQLPKKLPAQTANYVEEVLNKESRFT